MVMVEMLLKVSRSNGLGRTIGMVLHSSGSQRMVMVVAQGGEMLLLLLLLHQMMMMVVVVIAILRLIRVMGRNDVVQQLFLGNLLLVLANWWRAMMVQLVLSRLFGCCHCCRCSHGKLLVACEERWHCIAFHFILSRPKGHLCGSVSCHIAVVCEWWMSRSTCGFRGCFG